MSIIFSPFPLDFFMVKKNDFGNSPKPYLYSIKNAFLVKTKN